MAAIYIERAAPVAAVWRGQLATSNNTRSFPGVGAVRGRSCHHCHRQAQSLSINLIKKLTEQARVLKA
jgi:predicted CXXCH cytochrome family protein